MDAFHLPLVEILYDMALSHGYLHPSCADWRVPSSIIVVYHRLNSIQNVKNSIASGKPILDDRLLRDLQPILWELLPIRARGVSPRLHAATFNPDPPSSLDDSWHISRIVHTIVNYAGYSGHPRIGYSTQAPVMMPAMRVEVPHTARLKLSRHEAYVCGLHRVLLDSPLRRQEVIKKMSRS